MSDRFELGISPLDYKPSGYPAGSIQRVSLIDDEAPPPDPKHWYFAPQEQLVRRSPSTGRRYKKPRVKIIPGADDPQTVAFVDFYVEPDGKSLTINYVQVRPDMRGLGLSRRLIDDFIANAERSGVEYVTFGRIMNPAIWRIYQDHKARYDAGESSVYMHAKRDF